MVIMPCASMPMTPAETPGEHGLGEAAAAVDEVARGRQAVMLAAQLRRHLVEGLAEMGEVALARAAPAPGRRNCRSPPGRSAWISRRIGATSRLAKFRPNQIAESSTISAISANIDAKAIWMPGVLLLERQIIGDAGLGDRRELDRARIDLAGDVAGSGRHRPGASASTRKTLPVARNEADRLGRRSRPRGPRPSAAAGRRSARGSTLLDDRAVGLQDHRDRKAEERPRGRSGTRETPCGRRRRGPWRG